MVDADDSLRDYFKKHLAKIDTLHSKPYEIDENMPICEFLKKVEASNRKL